MTDEPMVVYPLRDVLARIEGEMTELRKDVHAMQLTLATGSAAAVSDAARHAASRARVATWAAVAAVVAGPLSAILIAVTGGH